MTLAQTPAVRHYVGWRYDHDDSRPHRMHWKAEFGRKGNCDMVLYAMSEAALKRKIDNWFDQQGD